MPLTATADLGKQTMAMVASLSLFATALGVPDPLVDAENALWVNSCQFTTTCVSSVPMTVRAVMTASVTATGARTPVLNWAERNFLAIALGDGNVMTTEDPVKNWNHAVEAFTEIGSVALVRLAVSTAKNAWTSLGSALSARTVLTRITSTNAHALGATPTLAMAAKANALTAFSLTSFNPDWTVAMHVRNVEKTVPNAMTCGATAQSAKTLVTA